MAQLHGLYPDGTGPSLPDNIDPENLKPPYLSAEFALPNGFQPIPVHDGEEYLENCDTYKEW